MGDGFHKFTVEDQTYGEIRLMVVVPRGDDIWGVLAPLRGTIWAEQVRVITGEAMAHARHRYAAPLMKELGPPPRVSLARIPDLDGMCTQAHPDLCVGAARHCRPGLKLPNCYEPPAKTIEEHELKRELALAWRDGWYVVVVSGPEFNLR